MNYIEDLYLKHMYMIFQKDDKIYFDGKQSTIEELIRKHNDFQSVLKCIGIAIIDYIKDCYDLLNKLRSHELRENYIFE